MRKYLFITSLVAILNFLGFFIFFRKLEIPFYIYLTAIIIPSVFILSSLFISKINLKAVKILLSVLLIIASIPIYLYFISTAVLIAVNAFSHEPLKKEEIILELGTREEEENFVKLNQLLNSFEQKVNLIEKKHGYIDDKLNSFNYNDNIIKKALESTRDERNKIINFLSNNRVSIPKQINLESLTVSKLLHFNKLELLEIKKMIETGNYEKGISRYISLWKMLENLTKIKNITLVYSVVIETMIDNTLEFYSSNSDSFNIEDIKSLSNTITNIDNNINKLFARAFATEYFRSKELLQVMNKIYPWPLLDYNKTMNRIHDFYNALITKAKNPTNKALEKADFNNESNFEMTFTLKDYIVNPIGNILLKSKLFLVGNLFYKEKLCKSKLRAFYYILNKDKGIDIPIDPLTEKKLTVKEYKDYYEVSTEYIEKDYNTNQSKHAFMFKVKK